MGRSTASCFKIIACGNHSADKDDPDAPEYKDSSDKRGWSFRKQSARHRVLSNSVEMQSSLNKESPEIHTVNLQTQSKMVTFAEKTSEMPCTDERPQLTAAIPEVSNTIVASENEELKDVNLDESVIVIVQTAIRGFLAQRQVVKVKNVVKLQAAVRGHLVRRHAVGTLRCVQAIVKMQALVRARQARLSSEGKLEREYMKDNHGSKPSVKENSVADQHAVHTSTEKLLSNKFAHQLLESTPRTKSIHVKCDASSRSGSAWNWLERWMSVSSKGADLKSPSEVCESIDPSKEADLISPSPCGSVESKELKSPSERCESADLKLNNTQTVIVPCKNVQSSLTCDAEGSPENDNLDPDQPVSSATSFAKEVSSDLLSDKIKQSHSASELEPRLASSNPDVVTEHPIKSVKRSAPEEAVESEGKRFAFGTRKATNPAFIAVQSKFEELSATPSLARSTSSRKQHGGGEPNSGGISSSLDYEITGRDIDLGENSVSHTLAVKVGGSECGTELSITSTLDSPDGSHTGAVEVEHEAELKQQEIVNINPSEDLVDQASGDAAPGVDLSHSVPVKLEKVDNINGADEEPLYISTTAVASKQEQKQETSTPNEKIDTSTEFGNQASKLSAEASPRSQMTHPELETPSSQVSAKAKKTKSDQGSSNQKNRASSAGKSSPSNPSHRSGSKSSLDPFPKDLKTGKRRNSFGSGRSDCADQEPRDSGSGNSLPSYMQATESAKAKALANSSPRSSPDVQDKEIYIKKRHSLPGAGGKQCSPRLQHSKSKAHQSAKSNGQPQERKWQR